MALMTFAITLAFLIRSSSLIGWIPLAYGKIHSTPHYVQNFLAILQSGLFVSVPTIIFSICVDSYYYGKWTVPQYNFVHVNVVLGLSDRFGVEPWFYYLKELPNFLSSLDGDLISLFGFALFTVYQINGSLHMGSRRATRKNAEEVQRFPFFVPFVVGNLYVLSSVGHKEQRFMTQLFPIFGIFWSYFFLKLSYLLPRTPFFKWLIKAILIIYTIIESEEQLRNHQSYHRGDIEMYSLMHGSNSHILLDYTQYMKDNNLDMADDFRGFDRVESVYTNSKYDTPVTTWLHTPGLAEEKITALYPSF